MVLLENLHVESFGLPRIMTPTLIVETVVRGKSGLVKEMTMVGYNTPLPPKQKYMNLWFYESFTYNKS